ncbi:MAG: biotin carboxylase N-terminal domain-containing protein [Desulfovibrionaceae bacterium]
MPRQDFPHTILVANRGEIAMRVMRAARALGHAAVAVYTASDRRSGHVRLARELARAAGADPACAALRIGSYQDDNEIFAVADACGATAVHPGYGFFAEDFRFARRAVTRDRPLVFIGPSWWVIRDLGDKISTKRLARSLAVPTIPGSDRPIYDELEAEEMAASLFAFQAEQGIPRGTVLVKASAGGGGMGIEEVHDMDLFRRVLRRVRSYAKRQWGDEGVLIEQRIFGFNHLEVQILGDREGEAAVHFGTRNCSVQSPGRQKRIEAAPGFVPAEVAYAFDARAVLEQITNHSLAMAQQVGYDSAGTWEWIVTPRGEPFLMEVNTRIQVENGVSGAIARLRGRAADHGGAGVDLIREQIRLALAPAGETGLGYGQDDLDFEGVAVEYRLLAEDPAQGFRPWLGTVERFAWAPADWLTVHTHVPQDRPYEIPVEFDPNLALGIDRGRDLAEAKARGDAFLASEELSGRDAAGRPLVSNVAWLREKNRNLLEF